MNLLTTAQAARQLGVSVRTVQAWIAGGKLRAAKRGRDYDISPADLARVRRGKRGRPKRRE